MLASGARWSLRLVVGGTGFFHRPFLTKGLGFKIAHVCFFVYLFGCLHLSSHIFASIATNAVETTASLQVQYAMLRKALPSFPGHTAPYKDLVEKGVAWEQG